MKRNTQEKIDTIFNYLSNEFPNPKSELNYNNNFELICAVILSAQCTDKRVNQVTPQLFKNYPSPSLLANANQVDVEEIIHSCGFYHNKAKSLINMSKDLCKNFNGEVPNDFDKLLSLQGVGRKTANVVLAVAFDKSEMPVDTHVFRVSRRLGLSNGKTPEKVEQDLRKVLKGRKLQIDHHLMILFGRYICKAQNPNCEKCQLKQYCNYYNEKQKISKKTNKKPQKNKKNY